MEISSAAISYLGKGIVFILKKLLSKPVDYLTKMAFQRAYYVSNLYKSYSDSQQLFQTELNNYVNLSVNWKRLFLGKVQTGCTLWVKAKEGQQYARMTICVTATSEKLRYQSIVTVIDVNEIPCVVALPSIPLREIENKNGLLYQAYDTVTIELIELINSDHNPVMLGSQIKKSMHPLDNLAVALGKQKGDVFRWGQWWNLDFLEREKHELRVTLHGMHFRAKFDRRKSIHFWGFLAWLSKKHWFLELCFWLRNIFTARHLEAAFNADCKNLY